MHWQNRKHKTTSDTGIANVQSPFMLTSEPKVSKIGCRITPQSRSTPRVQVTSTQPPLETKRPMDED